VSDGGSTIVVPLPAGLTPVDVATGRQRDKVRAATTVRLASEPLRIRASGFEPTVVVTDAMGVAIEPDLAAARAGVAPVPVTGGEMTFTFDSPASPWTPAELASLQALLRDAYPVAKAVDGPPLFNLSVNVRKDPTSPFIGYYNASINEMTLRGLVRPDVVVHEMLHAFRDDVIMCPMTFEEGMTRAAEVEVMSRIPEGEGYFDLHHSYGYDVYYDALNDQRIGAANGSFFAGEDALFLMRYQLSGYAWGKAFIEDPAFFAKFNAVLYTQSLTDPSVRCTESTLATIAAKVKHQVEGRRFATWYRDQGVLNTHPPAGDFLYQRINQFTIDDFSRDAADRETMHAAVPVTWQLTDFAHRVLDGGTALTEPLGWIGPNPRIPAGYTGRVEMAVSAPGPEDTIVHNAAIRTARDGVGVFGAVARDLPGTITVVGLSSLRVVARAAIVDGAFDLPSLASLRGRFRAVLVYSDGLSVTRSFTKDASSYYLRMPVAD